MKLYSNPPCHTHHSPTTRSTPCGQQYPKAMEVLPAQVIRGRVLQLSKSPKATARPQAQAQARVTLNSNLHKILIRDSTLPPLHKVRFP